MPGVFYRSLAAELAPPLVIIFQQSFLSGRMPDQWRSALVVPVFKKGRRDVASNYRPISLTCVACKLFERILCKAMYEHLSYEKLLSNSQHGFRCKRSTTSALLHSCYVYMSHLDNRSDVDCIMFDFSKAFDTVNHQLLLVKIKAYGFGKYTCSWIADFLSNRSQCVRIGNAVARSVIVPSGVIQGSVLGPLLFIIYINDLPDVIVSSASYLYADDFKLVHGIKCNVDRSNLQANINAVFNWSNLWLMSINLSKLAYLHLGNRFCHHTYFCDSAVITRHSEVKDLGVHVSEQSNFRVHYNDICRKAYAISAQIFRSFECRDTAFLVSLFNMYVRPILEFSCQVWSPHLKCDVAQIERVQRSYTRRIPGLSDLNYAERLRACNILSLEHRRLYLDLVLLYNIVHGHSDLTLHSIGLTPVCNTKLRNYGYHIYTSFIPSSSLSLYCFSHRTSKLWNNLPRSFYSLSLNAFKCNILKLDLPSLARGTKSPYGV